MKNPKRMISLTNNQPSMSIKSISSFTEEEKAGQAQRDSQPMSPNNIDLDEPASLFTRMKTIIKRRNSSKNTNVKQNIQKERVKKRRGTIADMNFFKPVAPLTSPAAKKIPKQKTTSNINKFIVRRDSDLESQMDDYMIDQSSDQLQDNAENLSASGSEESSEGLVSLDQNRPEVQVLQQMEEFYNDNFSNYLIGELSDVIHERVWNVYFDKTYDMIYVFVARLSVLEGSKIIEESSSQGSQKAMTSLKKKRATNQRGSDLVFKTDSDSNNLISPNARRSRTINHSQQIQKDFSNDTARVDLFLQIWDLDDRIIRDKDHRKIPIFEQPILGKEFSVSGQRSLMGIMDEAQNKFRDFAQLSQNQSIIYIINDQDELLAFDTNSRRFHIRKLRKNLEMTDDTLKSFATALHYKDFGKKTQALESILVFSYLQIIPKIGNDKVAILRRLKSAIANEISMKMAGNTIPSARKMKQKLFIKQIQLSDLKNEDDDSIIKAKESYILIEDEQVAQYYDGLTIQQKPIFVKRIFDSHIYIVLFPTGLLINVNQNPIQIQAKTQLNLKQDETIIDCSYNVDENSKNHCLWLLDEKMQVWKCQNDLNPQSCNWTISKVALLDQTRFKRFFQPAMTYDDFYITSKLLELGCLAEDEDAAQNFEYFFVCNKSATKALVVKQPMLRGQDCMNEEASDSESNPNHEEERKSEAEKRTSILKNKIQLFAIYKNQQIIMNKIPEKILDALESRDKFVKRLSTVARDFKFRIMKEINDHKLAESDEIHQDEELESYIKRKNEILEVLYSGKIKRSQQNQQAVAKSIAYRQFIIRRKRSVEVMMTNGLTHWQEFIPEVDVNAPLMISEIYLSNGGKTLIVYITHQGNKQVKHRKILKRNDTGRYEHFQDSHNSQKNSKLLSDSEGNIYNVQLELMFHPILKQTTHITIEKQPNNGILITLPEGIAPKELLEPGGVESFQVTNNWNTILCGSVMIRMNETFDNVIDAGCFVISRQKKDIDIKFFSLRSKSQRKIIQSLIAEQPSAFLKFTGVDNPILPKTLTFQHFYALYRFEDQQEETLLLKVRTDTLTCSVAHVSKYKINHVSLRENTDCSPNQQRAQSRQSQQVTSSQIGIYDPSPGRQDCFIWLSLISQKSNQVQIEIMRDKPTMTETKIFQLNISEYEKQSNNVITPETSFAAGDESKGFIRAYTLNRSFTEHPQSSSAVTCCFKKNKLTQNNTIVKSDTSQEYQCYLESLITVSLKEELFSSSQVQWITLDKLLVTINNDFYLVSLRHSDLKNVKNQIAYGIQIINQGLYCSLVNAQPSMKMKEAAASSAIIRKNQKLLASMQCIQRMELASLRKYVQLKQCYQTSPINFRLLFFMPSEELNGGNIFSKLSSDYAVIQPFIDIIDGEFIQLMNRKVQSIAVLSDPRFYFLSNFRRTFDYEDLDQKRHRGDGELSGEFVHMYQSDILGRNAIDFAFSRNSIFCIKAFVESLMILPGEVQFRNCFDKALLLMINRSIDVTELLNSQLFYPEFWQKHSLYSSDKEKILVPYNNDLEELEYEDPQTFFQEQSERLPGKRFIQQLMKSDEEREEQFEMQFNYILMERIEGGNKIEVSRTLKDCPSITLFEQESIQNIIDYKWETYAKDFFLDKFLIYAVFLLLYYIDLESMPGEGIEREKGLQFYFFKIVCSLIQIFFFFYEIMQIKTEFYDYFYDAWNYMELLGNFFYAWGTWLDITRDRTDDEMRLVLAFSIMFTLIKVVYLIRVFRQLNFLVTMFMTVVGEIQYFLILFTLFLLTFAESFNRVDVDVEAYGRIPTLLAHFMNVLRCAMGDFSILHQYQGFDIIDIDENGQESFRHSRKIVIFTLIIFIFCCFFMFMIFMNFIIAVISQSYHKVRMSKEAFDYKLRASMIYEREVHFAKHTFENERNFPKIILIRKVKENEKNYKASWESYLDHIKDQFKFHSNKCLDLISVRYSELTNQISNQLKIVENDIQTINQSQQKTHLSIEKLLGGGGTPSNTRRSMSVFDRKSMNIGTPKHTTLGNLDVLNSFRKRQQNKSPRSPHLPKLNNSVKQVAKKSSMVMSSNQRKSFSPESEISSHTLSSISSKEDSSPVNEDQQSRLLHSPSFNPSHRDQIGLKKQSQNKVSDLATGFKLKSQEIANRAKTPEFDEALKSEIKELREENKELKDMLAQVLQGISELKKESSEREEKYKTAVEEVKQEVLTNVEREIGKAKQEILDEVKESSSKSEQFNEATKDTLSQIKEEIIKGKVNNKVAKRHEVMSNDEFSLSDLEGQPEQNPLSESNFRSRPHFKPHQLPPIRTGLLSADGSPVQSQNSSSRVIYNPQAKKIGKNTKRKKYFKETDHHSAIGYSSRKSKMDTKLRSQSPLQDQDDGQGLLQFFQTRAPSKHAMQQIYRQVLSNSQMLQASRMEAAFKRNTSNLTVLLPRDSHKIEHQ